MTNSGCSSCNGWTINGARFCHHCGHILGGMSFEYATGSGSVGVSGPTLGASGQSVKDKAATTGLIALAMSAGTLTETWGPEWIALGPLAYLLYPYAHKLLLDLAGKLPEKQPGHTKIKVEHSEKTIDGKRILIDEYPEEIELSHIQHIAKVCLPNPAGRGLEFSRLNVCRPGKLSQGQFRIIRDIWLESHHAFYRNPLVKNQGLVLTERCNRLLKKSLSLVVVD